MNKNTGDVGRLKDCPHMAGVHSVQESLTTGIIVYKHVAPQRYSVELEASARTI